MAFSDHLSRGHLDAILVLHISGIPWLFSHVGCPVRWRTSPSLQKTIYQSWIYDWSNTLVIPDEFASVDTKLEPKAGLGQSGGIKFSLRSAGTQMPSTGDLWLDFMTNSLQRTDADRFSASIAEDIPVDRAGNDKQIKFFFNPWTSSFIDDRYLYFGLETLMFSATTSNTVTEITGKLFRGLFGSQAERHIGLVRGGESTQAGGKYVADYPLVWAGRIAKLYLVPGHLHGGVFYPHGVNLESAENQVIYRGFVNDLEEGGDMLGLTLPTTSLESGIKGQLVTDFPTAKLGVVSRVQGTGQPAQIYVGPHNWWLHMEVNWGANTVNPRLYIPDHALFLVGDNFNIGASVFTCVAGAPAAFQFNKGASVAVTYQNIVNAVAAQLNVIGNQTVIPSSWTLFVELLWVGPTHPSLVGLAATTTNPGALKFTTTNMKAVALQQFKELRLQRAQNNDGKAPWENVPEGLHGIYAVARYIRDTLHANLDALYMVDARLSDDFSAPDPEKRVMILDIKAEPVRLWESVTWTWITRWRGRESVLRDLGFTEDFYECQYEAQSLGFRAIASKRVSLFRWPAKGYPAPGRVYVHGFESVWQEGSWNHVGGWKDDTGADIARHAYIEGVGVFTYSTLSGGYLGSVARAESFGVRDEELYIEAPDEDDPKEGRVYRVPAFPGCSVNRIILYWLLGGSGVPGTNHADYDAGWEGAGLSLPADAIDVDSFEKLAEEVPNKRDNWVVLPGDDVRKLIEEELKLTQQQIVPGLGKLYMVSMEPPSEALPDTVEHVCGPAQTVTDPDKGVGFDRSPQRLVNNANVSADYDYGVKKFFLTVKNRAQDSAQTWGEKQPVQIEARGVRVGGDAESLSQALAMSLFAAYGRPYAVIEVDVAAMSAWLWRVGDVVKLTHPGLPHPTRAERGVVDLPCRIVAKGDHFIGQDGVFVTLTLLCRAYGGSRWSRWSPSAYLTYNGSSTVWRVKDHRFSRAGSALRDIEYFETGWRCRCAQWGFFSSVSLPTINAITLDPDPDESTVTLSASLGGTTDRVLWFERHDQASLDEDQRAWVYWSGGGGTLTHPTAANVRSFSLV